MPSVPNNVDWSATAAWIALVISIIGTVASPLITTVLTNRHQLKLRALDIKQNSIKTYEERRFQAITTFFQKTGGCFSSFNMRELCECGSVYHCVYQYVPVDFWPDLDQLYTALVNEDWHTAKDLYPPIARRLSEILKEPPQLSP